MLRRLLIGLSVTFVVLVVATLLFGVWLAGRPLAAPSPRRVTVVDGPCCGDLLPLPSTDIQGVSRTLSFLDGRDEEGARGEVERAITRTESHPTPPLRWTLNYLLVGLDRRPGTSRGGRTDTLVLVVFDRQSDHVGLVSIPRDLYVMVPDHGPARINAAYSIGRRQHRNGLEVLERVVEDTLAIPIHHTVAVDLNVFERAVDALGGVTVDVPCPIQDNFIDSRTPTGRRRLDVPAGPQHMDGVTAQMYVRSRHGRSDWDRARRQQAVLLAARSRLLSRGGIGRLPALWDQFGASVVTNMSRLELFALATRAMQADLAHVHGLVLGHRETDAWVTPENRWVLVPQFEAIDGALRQLFSAPSPGARPRYAVCPAADVALTRPDREDLRHRIRALRGRVPGQRSGEDQSSETASNSSHSSSPTSARP